MSEMPVAVPPRPVGAWVANVSLFLLTGVFTTIMSQWLVYAGGAAAPILPLMNYAGMVAVGCFPARCEGAPPRRDAAPAAAAAGGLVAHGDVVVPARRPLSQLLFACVALDLVGFVVSMAGLAMAGSGLYQVIYASIVCWSAIFSRLFMGQFLTTVQWGGIVLSTFGLILSALGERPGATADTGSVVLGCAVCLAGAIFMSLYYVCAEYVMKGPAPPSIRWLSWRIGGAAGSVLLVYMSFTVFPAWDTRVEGSVRAAGHSMNGVVFGWITLIASNLVHAATYFALMGSLGAVSTGLLQCMRAVVVFMISSVLFCSRQESQCFTGYRAASTAVVLAGVMVYCWGKAAVAYHKHDEPSAGGTLMVTLMGAAERMRARLLGRPSYLPVASRQQQQ